MRRPRAGFIPFGYPDYPQDVVKDFMNKGREEIESLDIEVFASRPVIVYEDHKKAIEDIRGKDVDFLVALVVSWVEAPNVISTLRPFFHKPILLWGMTTFECNGWRTYIGAITGSCVIRETLEEMDVKLKFVYGMPGSAKVKEGIREFAKICRAINLLSESRIGLIGYSSMGMYTGTFDHVSLRNRIGVEIEHLDTYTLIKHIEKTGENDELRRLVKEANENWMTNDKIDDEDYVKCMKMYLAIKSIIEEAHYQGLTIKCHYEMSRNYGTVACIPLAMLGDRYTISCEGDVLLIVTQLILHYLSGKLTFYFDILDITEKRILAGNCGNVPLAMARNGKVIISKYGAGKGLGATFGGLMNSSPYEEGKITFARMSAKGDRYRMHIATGTTVADIGKVHELDCPVYPGGEIILDGDTDHFGAHVMSQHYAATYADVKIPLIEFCKLLGIEIIVTER